MVFEKIPLLFIFSLYSFLLNCQDTKGFYFSNNPKSLAIIGGELSSYSISYGFSGLSISGVDKLLVDPSLYPINAYDYEINTRRYSAINISICMNLFNKVSDYKNKNKNKLFLSHDIGLLFPNNFNIDKKMRGTYNFAFLSKSNTYDSYWVSFNYTYLIYRLNLFGIVKLLGNENYAVLLEPRFGVGIALRTSDNKIVYVSDNPTTEASEMEYYNYLIKPKRLLLGLTPGINLKFPFKIKADKSISPFCGFRWDVFRTNALNTNKLGGPSNEVKNKLNLLRWPFYVGVEFSI
jgi:hypothetical protein